MTQPANDIGGTTIVMNNLIREKTTLEPLALAWEEHAGDRCVGTCVAPLVVAWSADQMTPYTCCEMRPVHERWKAIRFTESLVG
jgi:hypothetical protein